MNEAFHYAILVTAREIDGAPSIVQECVTRFVSDRSLSSVDLLGSHLNGEFLSSQPRNRFSVIRLSLSRQHSRGRSVPLLPIYPGGAHD
ncbi:hypothetical protein RRG08_014966 [Elysia crispata]|uniref:Uncharacterized protein n=1 Tax=Elysia crispata TaxID=231223 RepID=A0AAE1A9U9_9GAST|nr:hypothetical protein RRG08_014966 [Elysia crispata]